jgi:hypothetical protein
MSFFNPKDPARALALLLSLMARRPAPPPPPTPAQLARRERADAIAAHNAAVDAKRREKQAAKRARKGR